MQQPAINSEMQQTLTSDNLMMLSLDGINLFIPKDSIKTHENIHGLDVNKRCKNSAGWLNHLNSKIPVYCFNKDFDPMLNIPNDRSTCVILNKGDLAIMCSDIKVLPYPVLDILSLPDCMVDSGTPVDAFCLYQHAGEVVLGMIFTASSLIGYINRINRSSMELRY